MEPTEIVSETKVQESIPDTNTLASDKVSFSEPIVTRKQRQPFVFTEARKANLAKANSARMNKMAMEANLQKQYTESTNELKQMFEEKLQKLQNLGFTAAIPMPEKAILKEESKPFTIEDNVPREVPKEVKSVLKSKKKGHKSKKVVLSESESSESESEEEMESESEESESSSESEEEVVIKRKKKGKAKKSVKFAKSMYRKQQHNYMPPPQQHMGAPGQYGKYGTRFF
jgi:hypothetical protein